MNWHHPKRPANQLVHLSYDGVCYYVQTPASNFFFWTVQNNLCSSTCRLDTCQGTPETLNSHWFLASLIACMSLQHHGSPFYRQFSYRETYTGDGHCTVHGGCSIALVKSSYLSTLYIWIKTPTTTGTVQRGSLTPSEGVCTVHWLQGNRIGV